MGSSTGLKVDVGAVLAGTGRRLVLDEYLTLPAFETFAFPSPAHVVLDLAGVDRGVHVDGAIDVEVHGQCDRCLEEVMVPLHVEVEERFEAGGGKDDPLDVNNVLDGDTLDVADLVRQLTASALPMGVLCKDTCQGLCPRCGLVKNEGGCTCPPGEDEHG
jgi:uncharacterized protein